MNGPVRHYPHLAPRCRGELNCRRKAVFASGRCGPCEDAASRRDFAVLVSYLRELKT